MKKISSPKLGCEDCESRGAGVFCELESAFVQEFDQSKTVNQYKKGQIIFYEENFPFGLYCVYSGLVKLYKTGMDGRPQILRIAGPGNLLGYRSLFAEESYHATAEVLEDATICFIDKNTFFSVLARDHNLFRNIIKKLSLELRVAEGLATSLAQRSARERMAELLLMLKETYGKKNKLGTTIGLKLSREEMAEMIGTTQETAIRFLSEFKKEGWIQVQDREITILKPKSLLKTANLEK